MVEKAKNRTENVIKIEPNPLKKLSKAWVVKAIPFNFSTGPSESIYHSTSDPSG